MQCKEHVDVVKTPRFHFTFVATLLPASPKNKKKALLPARTRTTPFFPKQFSTPASRPRAGPI